MESASAGGRESSIITVAFGASPLNGLVDAIVAAKPSGGRDFRCIFWLTTLSSDNRLSGCLLSSTPQWDSIMGRPAFVLLAAISLAFSGCTTWHCNCECRKTGGIGGLQYFTCASSEE